MNVNVSCTLDF